MTSTKISVLIVSLVLISGLGMYFFSLHDDSVTGAIITATSGRQCDDTDNNNPSTGPRAEQEGTDSIWVRGGVKTRVNSRATWSSIDYDSCASSTVLREKYCDSSGNKISEDVTCTNGCASGKCNLPTCSDPDGENYGVRSSTTGFLASYRPLGVPPDQTIRNYTDACASSSVLKEYKCQSATSVSEKRKACSEVGSGFVCRNGACVVRPTTETICDGLDDNGNGVVDEGCDDDNDDYCDLSMIMASPYSCTPTYFSNLTERSNCCPLGGGDCQDYASFGGNQINPGAQENCFNDRNDNCNNQTNEGCEPYTCEDTDPSNDPYVGGSVTYTAANGQATIIGYGNNYLVDSCVNATALNQTDCNTLTRLNSAFVHSNSVRTPCPSGTTCSDSDGLTGPIPAVCA